MISDAKCLETSRVLLGKRRFIFLTMNTDSFSTLSTSTPYTAPTIMKPRSSSALLWAAVIPALAIANAAPDPVPSNSQLKALVPVACYSSSTPLEDQGPYIYQSSGWCQDFCVNKKNQPVMGLSSGSNCWCGSKLPSNSSKVDDKNCNSPCTGYDQATCMFWTIHT